MKNFRTGHKKSMRTNDYFNFFVATNTKIADLKKKVEDKRLRDGFSIRDKKYITVNA
jgi:hypothetical protein